MQFFEAFVNYFTEEEWTAMQNSDASLLEIRQIIFQRVFALGGRCPSEGTKRLMACLILMLTHDMKIPIEHREKTSTLDSVRCAWSVFARRSSPPPEHIEKLPSSPFVYQRQHARLHGLAYVHGATPIPCRLNPLSLEALSQSFGCRGNKESPPMLRLASRESSSASLAPMLRLGDDSLDGLASCFAEELRRQGERQDRMMEMLLNHQNQQRQPLIDFPGGSVCDANRSYAHFPAQVQGGSHSALQMKDTEMDSQIQFSMSQWTVELKAALQCKRLLLLQPSRSQVTRVRRRPLQPLGRQSLSWMPWSRET